MSDVPENLEPKIDDNIQIALISLINLIPAIGGSISSVISGCSQIRYKKRMYEFLQGMEIDFRNTAKKIREDFVTKEDFYELFGIALEKAVKSREEEKRTAFRKILLNASIEESATYNELESFLDLLDQMQGLHIQLLKILKDPRKYDAENDNLLKNGTGGSSTSQKEILDTLLPNWDKGLLSDVLIDLVEKFRLARNIGYSSAMVTAGGYEHIENRLTEKGIRFARFLME